MGQWWADQIKVSKKKEAKNNFFFNFLFFSQKVNYKNIEFHHSSLHSLNCVNAGGIVGYSFGHHQ